MMPVASEDNQTIAAPSRKTTSGSSLRPPEKSPNCPRCDSPNTKFCYYNNYSLSQPRHFCKTCRRYWTKGGALRNVPIGGGCRKTNKKTPKSSSSNNSSSSSEISSAFKFLHGISPPIDFQFGRLSSATNNQFLSFENLSTTSTTTTTPSGSYMGLGNGYNWGIEQNGTSSNLASSIECLSSINQDLHWKLQQQRLAMVLGGGENQTHHKEITSNNVSPASVAGVLPSAGLLENQMLNQQPINFQNLEISKPCATTVVPTSTTAANPEWFYQNPYTPLTTNNSNHNNNNNGSSHGNDNISNWNGVHAWSYSDLPQ